MRLLLVNYEYPPVGGGSATATEAIAEALARLGHQVVVMTGRSPELAVASGESGVTVHRIPSWRRDIHRSSILEMISFLASGLIFSSGIIRKHKVEASIVFFSFPSGPIGLLNRRIGGIPFIISLRGGDVPGTEPSLATWHKLLRPLRHAVLREATAVVANSEGLRDLAERADQTPVHVIPNGVDTDFFVPKGVHSGGTFRILFVGRFQKQKNLDLLLQQASRLAPGSFEIHLVGDGPDREELQHLAAELKIASLIAWHGWVARSSLPDLYAACDCLVNPSSYEGMPNAVLEAMACGLPVVASNVLGNDAVVRHEETGYLFELAQPYDLGDALNRLILDRALAHQWGAAGRRRALEDFSWLKTAAAYLDLLSDQNGRTGR
jgi:glycosyltransferase involved in cell wall biosynthesis